MSLTPSLARPCCSSLTSMLVAPASREFSTSSLTALQTLVTTWLLFKRLTVSSDSGASRLSVILSGSGRRNLEI